MRAYIFGLPLPDDHLFVPVDIEPPFKVGQIIEFQGKDYEAFKIETGKDCQNVYLKEGSSLPC